MEEPVLAVYATGCSQSMPGLFTGPSSHKGQWYKASGFKLKNRWFFRGFCSSDLSGRETKKRISIPGSLEILMQMADLKAGV